MASSEFDTLAVASDLEAAGVQTAHAEAIVRAVTQATGRLVTESRFDVAISELRHDMETGLARQAAALETGLAKQAAALETALAKQTAALAKQSAALARQSVALAELRRDMEVGFAQQTAAFADAKAEIYRYLWVLGGSLVAVLSSLYMLAETWSRGTF
ncbi:MAG: hypothetical protein OXQ29_20665 [Rhodospirillaceae bacterium]|nr:hypothetical protein [Rhodospirillaceae bacterium]